MTTPTEREAFEAWYIDDAKRQGYNLTPEEMKAMRDPDGYGDHRVMLNGKWEGWQASRKQALKEAAMRATSYVTGSEAAVAIKGFLK